jgi:hypothetical protein
MTQANSYYQRHIFFCTNQRSQSGVAGGACAVAKKPTSRGGSTSIGVDCSYWYKESLQ